MQSYNLALSAAQPYTAIQATGDMFVYESGSAGSDTAERRIVIKPDADAEITLRPGQRFRLAPGEKASTWNVRTLDPTVTLTGSIIIGSGEFDDANTLNTFKLDGTFTNSVNVNNTNAQRVPVTLDVSQLLKIDPSIPLTVAGSTVQYTNSFANSSTAASVAIPVFTAAQNVNGAYIEFAEISMNGGATTAGNGVVSIIAKNTPPVSEIDGDVIFIASCNGNNNGGSLNQVSEKLPVRVKIAAGKGLYINQTGNVTTSNKTVLFTLL